MQLPAYKRDIVRKLEGRLAEERRFIQVITGPRQTGKTTAILQALEDISLPSIYAAADYPSVPDFNWIEARWNEARLKATTSQKVLLVLDGIQKINRWDETVKAGNRRRALVPGRGSRKSQGTEPVAKVKSQV